MFLDLPSQNAQLRRSDIYHLSLLWSLEIIANQGYKHAAPLELTFQTASLKFDHTSGCCKSQLAFAQSRFIRSTLR